MAGSHSQNTPIRDGTSRADRSLAALSPAHVLVEERTHKDLLAFAQAYASNLKYFAGGTFDHTDLDWAGFFNDIDLQKAIEYLQRPQQFSEDQARPYTRPHFVLLLVFLELLGHARKEINTLTRRHLEFFYRDVLGMVRRPAAPDRVHVLVELEPGISKLRVPAGTRFSAGEGRLGQPLGYASEQELIASQVEIASLRTLYIERKITGLQQACPPIFTGSADQRKAAFVRMLEIALGQPSPGDSLPSPLYSDGPAIIPDNAVKNFQVVVDAHDLLQVVKTKLGFERFSDFRELMRLKQSRDANQQSEWRRMNEFLQTAGRKARSDDTYAFMPDESDNFDQRLQAALNLNNREFEALFDGMPEVTNIDDVYVRRKREDVKAFIKSPTDTNRKSLYMTLKDFNAMMLIKARMDQEWEAMNRLIEAAGQHKQSESGDITPFVLSEAVRTAQMFQPKLDQFSAAPYFTSSINNVVMDTIDSYYTAFCAVERSFYMTAEDYTELVPVVGREGVAESDPQAWNQVYKILTNAHRQMSYSRRSQALMARVRASGHAVDNPIQALVMLLKQILCKDLSDVAGDADQLINKLEACQISKTEKDVLRTMFASAGGEAPDWNRICTLLEAYDRNLNNYRPPVPELLEWRNLCAAADARVLTVETEIPSAAAVTSLHWNTFGRAAPIRTQAAVPKAAFGCAIASPLLQLAEGNRSITLTLGFSEQGFDLEKVKALLAPAAGDSTIAGFNPFQVELSTADGWLRLPPTAVQLSWQDADMAYHDASGSATDRKGLILTCTLTAADPALQVPDMDRHAMAADAPAIRLLLLPQWHTGETCYTTESYDLLRKLVLMHTRLAVEVDGLQHLTIANDQNVLDPSKPFEPFGYEPVTGSKFYFGHPEIVGKQLDSLELTINWMGVPKNLEAHYRNYPGGLDATKFTAKGRLVENNVATDWLNGPLSLFDAHADANVDPVERTVTLPSQAFSARIVSDSSEVTEWNRYLLLELQSPDFQHSHYPVLALQKSLELTSIMKDEAEEVKKKLEAVDYQVNPPYTPQIKSLTLDYSASDEIDWCAGRSAEPTMTCYHIEPFGYAEQTGQGVPLGDGIPLLPQYNFEGELMIGLRHVSAPQTLALLFQMDESSADPDLPQQVLQWSYLSGNRWLPLPESAGVVADHTRGLLNSGIVELKLPSAQPNTRLPAELYWVRVAIKQHVGSVCNTVAIHPNALLATLEDPQNAADPLDTALPPGRITAPQLPIAGMAALQQPYSSFGGRGAEPEQEFFVRVSERLRHKDRALTRWDYERLVLQAFPDLYKVKCLPLDPHRLAGNVRTVVIPNIKNRVPFRPFEPKVSADTLLTIQRFLQERIPPFVQVEVVNPRYVPIKISCGICFMPDQDVAFCQVQLNEALKQFLSPWAYQEGADMVIGGSLYANSIIAFINARPYVDYVRGFSFLKGASERLVSPEAGAAYHVQVDAPDQILVSAQQHQFDLIRTAADSATLTLNRSTALAD